MIYITFLLLVNDAKTLFLVEYIVAILIVTTCSIL